MFGNCSYIHADTFGGVTISPETLYTPTLFTIIFILYTQPSEFLPVKADAKSTHGTQTIGPAFERISHRQRDSQSPPTNSRALQLRTWIAWIASICRQVADRLQACSSRHTSDLITTHKLQHLSAC